MDFFEKLDDFLKSRIRKIIRLTPNIIEIIIYSPLAARNFKPGQFYRLQNFINSGNFPLLEPIALTGASVDKENGLISLILLEMGGSSNLCQYLAENEEVILMGPTGTPTEIFSGKNILLVGGGLGNAVLFSIGKAFRDAGSKVLYVAGYKKNIDRYKIKEIEDASDVIIWSCDEESDFLPSRPQDKKVTGNIIDAIISYGEGKLNKSEQDIKLNDMDHVVVIGSDRMMKAFNLARNDDNLLKPFLNNNYTAVASINSPMQCMMKEICGQCLQKHIHPITKEEIFVYSCYNQDQDMNMVCFDNLSSRLKQNSLQEKITKRMLERK